MILGRKEVRTIAYVTNSYIEHSGILGMKWGQRNGPPYPIRDGGHSAAEVKANPQLARGSGGGSGSSPSGTNSAQTTEKHRHNPRRYSDDELKEHIDRMKAEEEYRRLNGQMTKQQIADLKSLVSKNVLGVATNELPKGAIEVGKEFYKILKTYPLKVGLLAWDKGLDAASHSIKTIFDIALKNTKKEKGDGDGGGGSKDKEKQSKNPLRRLVKVKTYRDGSKKTTVNERWV